MGETPATLMEDLLSLAKRIAPLFPDYYLAGGTALMFKHQHRESIDLDFFKKDSFSFRRVASQMREHFRVTDEAEGTDNIDLFIDGVKVSFVYFPFENRLPVEGFGGISIASDRDIFLNKVYAGGRRVDWKDPFDAAFLWGEHDWSVQELQKDFEKKFPDQSFVIHLGALASFEDYPELPEWVKEQILEMVRSSEENG